jgi:hypothetical protein
MKNLENDVLEIMEYDDKCRKIHAKLKHDCEYFWRYNDDSDRVSYEKIVNPYLNRITESWYDYNEDGHVAYCKTKTKDLYHIFGKESWFEYDEYGDIVLVKDISDDVMPNIASIKYTKYDEARMPIYIKEHTTYKEFNNTLDTEFWIGYDENGNEIYRRHKQKSTNVLFDEEDCEVWRIVDKTGTILKEFHNKNEGRRNVLKIVDKFGNVLKEFHNNKNK